MYPYNHKMGQTIQTDVENVVCDRAFLAHYQIPAAAAVVASNTAIHAAITLGAAAADVTTEITNPATPRCIRIKGNASGITGDVVIIGTNYKGETITETIAANGTGAIDGVKAFKTVTKITVPAKTNASGDTISVGFNEILGLPYLLPYNTVLKTYFDNGLEGTAPTVTVSATAIESNTIKLNSSLNTKIIDVYLIV